ncbi:MAG: L7Ae/L30e/S12e/Gadd45 family ribosomal protein [Oscillospiraceae bacterium]
MDNILRLIGLAKRGGNLEAGEEPVGAAARARDARVILVAEDAAENTRRRVRHFADAGQCLWLSVPYDKDELGRSIGRTSCAMLAITDVGLASAIVRKLAERDPETYGLSAEKLALKAQRAAERREEAQRHEKNLRAGRKKRPAPAAEAPVPRRSAPESGGRPPGKGGGRPGHGRPAGAKSERARGPYRKSALVRFAHSRPVKKGKGSVKRDGPIGPADTK